MIRYGLIALVPPILALTGVWYYTQSVLIARFDFDAFEAGRLSCFDGDIRFANTQISGERCNEFFIGFSIDGRGFEVDEPDAVL